MFRKFLIPLITAVFVTAPAFAPAPIAAGLSGSAQAKNLNSSRSNITRKKPVQQNQLRATTVKRSKSNTRDRMGGGGGGKGAGQLNLQPQPPGRTKY